MPAAFNRKLGNFGRADRNNLANHATILRSFFAGGLVGAIAFESDGFSSIIPIAALLMAIALPPLLLDLRARAASVDR